MTLGEMTMSDIIKKLFSTYPRDFYIFSFLVIFSTIVIVYINNVSMAPSKSFLELTKKEADRISEELLKIQNFFHVYSDYINDVIDTRYLSPDADLEEFMEEMSGLAELFIHSNPEVNGLVFTITDVNDYEKSQYYFAEEQRVYQNEVDIWRKIVEKYVALEEFLYVPMKDSRNRNMNWGNFYSHEGSEKRIIYLNQIQQNEDYVFSLGFSIDIRAFLGTEYTEDIIFTFINGDGSPFFSKREEYNRWPFTSPINFDDTISGHYNENKLTHIFRKDVEGTNWTYVYAPIATGHVLISAHRTSTVANLVNASMYIMALSALLCLWIVQKNLKTNKAPYEYFSDWLMAKYSHSLSKLEQNSNRAAYVIHLGLILVVVFYTLYAIVTRLTISTIFLHICLLTLILFTLRVYREKALSKRASNAFAAALLVVPLLVHLFEGGFSGDNPGASMIWMCAGVLLVLFVFGSVSARNTFRMFILLIFADSLIEINFLGNTNYQMIFSFTSGFFVLGFCLYAAVGHYVTKSHEDYEEINNLLHRLRESQSTVIEKEKMVVLGQLIAGIAHEINTPIGAIKASGEQIDSYFYENLKFIFQATKDFTEKEFEILYELIEAAKFSLAEMQSTSEVRAAKRKMFAYFEELAVPESKAMVEKFCMLELCKIEFFEERKEMLYHKKLPVILDVVIKLSPIITGTQTILFASGKVSKIVFALKSYAHTSESESRVDFDLLTTINNVLILYNNQIKKSVKVIINISSDIPQIVGNPDEISQVWSNLIHNALYAMNYEGTITIEAYTFEDCVRISFTDTGSGVKPENIEKIFTTFYTTKPAGEGSGLGLDISKKIIEAHDGKIWIESQLGVGTTFHVQLPIAHYGDSE